MKLTVIIFLATVFYAHASGKAQSITLKGRELTYRQVFVEIKKQTGYVVFGSKELIGSNARLSLTVSNAPLQEFLGSLLKNKPYKFEIVEQTIFIIKKSDAVSAATGIILSEPVPPPVNVRVLDSLGNPLPGASVAVKNSKNSGVTNNEGIFNLDVKEGDVIVVSYVGYETRQIVVSSAMLNASSIILNLKASDSKLEEIEVTVNTGYQVINRGNLTGSIVTVTSRELEKRNAVNIMQNLEGTVPGLLQYRGNATIRGVSTLQANANILVVVDGLPIEGSITDINPYDVESISVLKDAAAAAIYGARASNGVIVVTTKRAKEKGKTSVEFSSNITITEKPDYSYQNYMTPAQQVDWERDYYSWWFDGGNGTVANPVGDFESSIALGNPISPVQYAYYQLKKGLVSQAQLEDLMGSYKQGDFLAQYKEHALNNQVLQQHNLALRTNSGKAQNSLVVNYTTDNVGPVNAYNRRLNLFYKGSYNLSKWLEIDYGVNSIIGKERSHNNSFATTPFNVPSYYNLLNGDGSRAYYNTSRFNAYNTLTETTPALYSAKFNHLDELDRDFVNTSALNTRYYVNLNFKVLKGLTINPMFQYEDNRRNESAYSEAESYTMRWLQDVYTTRTGTPGNYTYTNLLPKGGKLATSQFRSPNYTARGQANYNRVFNKHGVIAMAGAEFRQTRSYGNSGILLGYDDQLQTQSTNNINFGNLFNINSSVWNPNYPARQYHFSEVSDIGLIRDEMHRFASGYANVTYTYDRKYNLFGSLRKDYADLFGGDEKYRGRPLWSVGASWIASNEAFLKVDAINYLKVRASYGLTGNIRNVTAVLAATTGMNNVTRLPNATVTNPPNPQLRWEKTATTNIGIDFIMLDNRLRASVDWYRRKGTDLFAQKRLDPSEGFTSMVVNNASMLNHGFEFNLTYDWIKRSSSDGLYWSSNITGAINKNRVTDVDELTRNPITLAAGNSYRVGYPVRSIFAFQFAGLNATGIPQFLNVKGEPTTASLGPNDAEALLFVGNSDPRMNLAFNNEFTWKGISLSVFAMYYGGHFFRARPVPIPYPYANYAPLPSYLLDSWTPGNTDTDIPGSGQYYQVPAHNQYYYSDNLVRPADFIKIRNIVLGYSMPKMVASKIKASEVKLRLQVNNPRSLWIKQKDVHVDPETGGAPIQSAFVFGINANF